MLLCTVFMWRSAYCGMLNIPQWRNHSLSTGNDRCKWLVIVLLDTVLPTAQQINSPMKACISITKPHKNEGWRHPVYTNRSLQLPNTLLRIIPPLLYFKWFFFSEFTPSQSRMHVLSSIMFNTSSLSVKFNDTKLQSLLILTTRQQLKLYYVCPGYKNGGKGYKNFSYYEQTSKSIFT